MDKFTLKTSFEQSLSPISTTQLEKLDEAYQLNYYTKMLRVVSETLFSDDLQKRFHQLFAIRKPIKSSADKGVPTGIFGFSAYINEKSQYEQRRKNTTPFNSNNHK